MFLKSMFQFYQPNVQSSIRHLPPPCSQCILFGDNGSHWKHTVHDWVITWSLVVCLSAGATTPGEQASQLTPCAKCIVLWAAHQITRLIGSFMQRAACGFNTFRCWYTVCVCVSVYNVHYYWHTYAMCVQGWTKQNMMIKHRMSSVQNMVYYDNDIHPLCCLPYVRSVSSSFASSPKNVIYGVLLRLPVSSIFFKVTQ